MQLAATRRCANSAFVKGDPTVITEASPKHFNGHGVWLKRNDLQAVLDKYLCDVSHVGSAVDGDRPGRSFFQSSAESVLGSSPQQFLLPFTVYTPAYRFCQGSSVSFHFRSPTALSYI